MRHKILHTADIHIGMENYGRINPETGLNTTLEAFCAAFDQAIDRAIDEPVDLVVLAGDIYKTRDPTPTHQREFARRIQRLIQAQIPVFIAPGNHDIPMAAHRASSVDIFRTLELPGVTVARTIGRWTIPTRAGPIQVLGLPWVTRSQILSRDEFKNKTIEQLNEEMVRVAGERLRELAESLDPSLPAIVVGHAHVGGARVGAERLLAMGNDPMFDQSTFLDLPHVAYVALGHIHKHQVLARDPKLMLYPGSINRVDFGEEDEPKGFVLAEIEGEEADYRFIQVDARRFLTIDAVADSDDPTRDVLKAIYRAGEGVRDAVVRLRIKTSRALAGRIDEQEIRGQLKDAFLLVPIQRELTDLDRERATAHDFRGKTPRELLQLYLEGKNVPADRRQRLLDLARGLMEEPP